MSGFVRIINQIDAAKVNKSNYDFEDERELILADILNRLEAALDKNERILRLLPLTDTENTANLTTGLMGFETVSTPEAKRYVKLFNNVRSHRILAFTSKRILLVFPVQLLEDRSFFSYFYSDIKAIMLRRNKKGIIESIRKDLEWYVLDFQAGNHIFTETLTRDAKNNFVQIIESIPAAKEIPIAKHVVRSTFFDRVVNNFETFIKLGYAANVFWFALLAVFVLGTLFGIGPVGGMQPGFLK